MVNSFAEVIDAFNGPAAFGRTVGMLPNAAKQAKRRNSLSPQYFAATAQAAQDRGLREITLKRLVELAEVRRRAGGPNRRVEQEATA